MGMLLCSFFCARVRDNSRLFTTPENKIRVKKHTITSNIAPVIKIVCPVGVTTSIQCDFS